MAGCSIHFPCAVHRERSIQATAAAQGSHKSEQGQADQEDVRNHEIAIRVRHCVSHYTADGSYQGAPSGVPQASVSGSGFGRCANPGAKARSFLPSIGVAEAMP